MAVHKHHEDDDDSIILHRTPAMQNTLCVFALCLAFCEDRGQLLDNTTIGEHLLKCPS